MANSKHVHTVTDASFSADVLKSDQLCLVDFWAEWCGPCRLLGPTIEQIAEEMGGKVKVFKMNVDDNPNTPTQYQIRGIPTVILFKGGQVAQQMVGLQPKDAYVKAISDNA